MTIPFSAHVIWSDRGPRWSTVVTRRGIGPCNDTVYARQEGATILAAVIDAVSSDVEACAATSAVLDNLPPQELSSRGLSDAFITADLDLAAQGVEYEVSAVALILNGRSATGCSAGDCEAWFVPLAGDPVQLTAGQNRRPRIGATVAPVEFDLTVPGRGLVIAASDGFWVNVSHRQVFDIARAWSWETYGGIASALALHVYERKGRILPDDIAVFVAEMG